MLVGLCACEFTLRCCAVQGESNGEHILILCNAIGSPVDSKVIELEPKFVALTGGLLQLFSSKANTQLQHATTLLCDLQGLLVTSVISGQQVGQVHTSKARAHISVYCMRHTLRVPQTAVQWLHRRMLCTCGSSGTTSHDS
jgi:hypothetical protein